MAVLEAKWAFRTGEYSSGERDYKRQGTLRWRLAALQLSGRGLQVLGGLCALTTCAALRMICRSRHH